MSVAGREVYDWLPIFELSSDDVFRIIAEAGQSPHPVYSFGLTRCSCSFYIFASRSDLRRAAELRPGLYAKYVQLERRIGHTLAPCDIGLVEPVKGLGGIVRNLRCLRNLPTERSEPAARRQVRHCAHRSSPTRTKLFEATLANSRNFVRL